MPTVVCILREVMLIVAVIFYKFLSPYKRLAADNRLLDCWRGRFYKPIGRIVVNR